MAKAKTKNDEAEKQYDPITDGDVDEGALPSVVEFDSDVDDQEAPKPIPKGWYNATITAAKNSMGKTSGKKYAELSMFVGEDQYPADFTDGEPDGMTIIYRRISLENGPRSRYRLKKFGALFGMKIGRTLDLAEFVDKELKIKIDHRQGEDGLWYPEIVDTRAA